MISDRHYSGLFRNSGTHLSHCSNFTVYELEDACISLTMLHDGEETQTVRDYGSLNTNPKDLDSKVLESKDLDSKDRDSKDPDKAKLDECATEINLEVLLQGMGLGMAQFLTWSLLSILLIVHNVVIFLTTILMPYLNCQWNLDTTLQTLIGSIHAFTYFVAGVTLGYLADEYGRKKIALITGVAMILSSILSAMAPNGWTFLFARIIQGVSNGAGKHVCYVFATETVSSKHKDIPVFLMSLSSQLGGVFLSLMSYVFLNLLGWRYLILILIAPAVISIIGLTQVPETSRYFLVTGRKEDALECLKKLYQWNGVEFPKHCTGVKSVTPPAKAEKSENGRLKARQLYRHGYARMTLLLSLMYFANLHICMVFAAYLPLKDASSESTLSTLGENATALSSNSSVSKRNSHLSNLPETIVDFSAYLEETSNVSTNFEGYSNRSTVQDIEDECSYVLDQNALIEALTSFLGDALGCCSSVFASKILGRKLVIRGYALLTLLTSLSVYFQIGQAIEDILGMLLRFSATGFRFTARLLTLEVFPTVLRSTASGFVTSCGQLGSTLGTALAYPVYPVSPIAVVSLIVGYAAVMLVASLIWDLETRDCVLTDNITGTEAKK